MNLLFTEQALEWVVSEGKWKCSTSIKCNQQHFSLVWNGMEWRMCCTCCCCWSKQLKRVFIKLKSTPLPHVCHILVINVIEPGKCAPLLFHIPSLPLDGNVFFVPSCNISMQTCWLCHHQPLAWPRPGWKLLADSSSEVAVAASFYILFLFGSYVHSLPP